MRPARYFSIIQLSNSRVCEEKKKKIIKIIRLDQISGVKEIL